MHRKKSLFQGPGKTWEPLWQEPIIIYYNIVRHAVAWSYSVASNDRIYFVFGFDIPRNLSNYYRFQNPFKREEIIEGKQRYLT